MVSDVKVLTVTGMSKWLCSTMAAEEQGIFVCVGQSSLRMMALKYLHLAGKGIPSRKNSKQRQESRAHRRKEGEAVLFEWVWVVWL